MNSKKLLLIKKKLNKYLKDKEVLDIILFGSVIKGKALPKDIDIAVISRKKISIPGFHVSVLDPEDFFVRTPSLVHTLFREGYSLKSGKFLSEKYKFSNKVMFVYELKGMKASLKVKIVNVLRKGFVLENKGEWLANQVFIIPVNREYIFKEFFLNFGVKFKKYHVLIH